MNRQPYIVINDNLPYEVQLIVAAHELGHDRLHRAFAKDYALQEFVLYDMKSRPEYEANVFAAELLIDTDEVLKLAREGFDQEQIAGQLKTDINLIGIKMFGR